VALLGEHEVILESLPEGSVFYQEDPVLSVTGRYLEFGMLETALLGVLCQASGVATRAARCVLAAGDRPVYSFGARRMHPAIAPMIERAAYVGGCEGVATVAAAELLDVEPTGTMAHAVILILGEERAWRAFDRVMDEGVPRVALVDTFQDERFGALAAAATLGDRLTAVRLDTPASRRGDLGAIVREVRWELDAHGFERVRIFVSGGLDEDRIRELEPVVDAFGVGTWIAGGPVVDFSLDIVEIDGEPRSKRGKSSGRKTLWRCHRCGAHGVAPAAKQLTGCPSCGSEISTPTQTWVAGGRPSRTLPRPVDVRALALREIGGAGIAPESGIAPE
jgi:nicotinate phosphoribosyltransferase